MPKGFHRPQSTCHPDVPHYAKGLCKSCYQTARGRVRWAKNPHADDRQRARGRAWYQRNREAVLVIEADRKSERKVRVLTRYGKDGTLCCRWDNCPISDLDMLTLDHVNDDGWQHRIDIGQSNVYRWVETNGFPDGFQTLCFNHQWKKEINLRRERRGY